MKISEQNIRVMGENREPDGVLYKCKGYEHKGLFVHLTTERAVPGNKPVKKSYTITHTKSGRAIAVGFKRMKQAKATARVLALLVDFSLTAEQINELPCRLTLLALACVTINNKKRRTRK